MPGGENARLQKCQAVKMPRRLKCQSVKIPGGENASDEKVYTSIVIKPKVVKRGRLGASGLGIRNDKFE